MRVLFFLLFSLMLGCNDSSHHSKLSTINKSSLREGISIESYLQEIGVPQTINSIRFSQESRKTLDEKFKKFIKKYEKQDFNEKHSAIDRASRIMLFDMDLLNSTLPEDKQDRDFYALEFLKNGGYDPESLFKIIKYVKTENLIDDKKIQKLNWALEQYTTHFSNSYIKNIESHSEQIKKEPRMKALYEPDDKIMYEKLKIYKNISEEIKNWPKTKLEFSKTNYSEIFNN